MKSKCSDGVIMTIQDKGVVGEAIKGSLEDVKVLVLFRKKQSIHKFKKL